MSGAAILWALLEGAALSVLVGLLLLLAVFIVALWHCTRQHFFHKVGGLWHWRLGRVGGSFYVTRR